jgi:hypothetical protein
MYEILEATTNTMLCFVFEIKSIAHPGSENTVWMEP